MDFQRFLVAFSHVERVTHRKHRDDSWVYENDTEHSYNLAMTAWFLAEYFPELDKSLVIKYALVHDLVEVHAGDTYVYADPEEIASKADRETKALKQLENDWPDFADLTRTIHEYEQKASPEANFIYALDKIMPIMMIYIHDGYTWSQEDINLGRLDEAKRSKVSLSPEILPYYEKLYEILLNSPHLIPTK